ncbi:hypothetical protein D3C87_1995430 [compost metagenome]
MDSHLMFDSNAANSVLLIALGAAEVFRNQKKRNTSVTRRSSRYTSQDQVQNVLSEIVLCTRNENLVASQRVGTVVLPISPGTH